MRLFHINKIILLLCFPCFLFAQNKDNVPPIRRGFLFPFSYKFQIPAANLAERFGTNFSVGSGILLKTEKNWIWGVEGSYLFGNTIRQNSLLNSYVYHSTGLIIDDGGQPANVAFNQRGWTATARIGKLIPLKPERKESGLLVLGGLGILQHKLHVDTRGSSVYVLNGPYVKGIDHLSNGFSLVQQIGYLHLDKRRLINFSISFEAYQAFTRNRRAYNFDEMGANDELRVDLLFGVRFSWILPVYREHSNQYFFD